MQRATRDAPNRVSSSQLLPLRPALDFTERALPGASLILDLHMHTSLSAAQHRLVLPPDWALASLIAYVVAPWLFSVATYGELA